MSEQAFDRAALQRQYERLSPKYKQLEASLKRDLKTCLQTAGVKVLSFESRIKEFDSFWDKALRKHYGSPLDDTDDICGIRIICHYPSDVERVCQVLENELEVKESEDKADQQAPQEFGYLSRHLMVAPKEHWLETPSYKGLNGLRAEIQVRTLFQHAWAELSHELSYKKEKQVPRQFRRKVHQLSAMLENLDEQFEALHSLKLEYAGAVYVEAQETGRFDTDQEVNIDSLQALLDFYFPDRIRNVNYTGGLLGELALANISMRELVEGIERTTEVLSGFEEEALQWGREHDLLPEPLPRWTQVGALRNILLLTSDAYMSVVRSSLPRNLAISMLEPHLRWRVRLSEQSR